MNTGSRSENTYDGYEADARVHLVAGMGADRTSVAEIAKAPRLEEEDIEPYTI